MNPLRALLVAAVFGACAVPAVDASRAVESSTWGFDVYLDDSKIGYHDFRVWEGDNGMQIVEANARFDVRVLFFNAYRYRHEISETWSGDCLTAVDAITNANGKRTAVAGRLTDTGFTVATGDAEKNLDQCVMTFAYWNPRFLEQQQLLNPQTGEFVEVKVEPIKDRTLTLSTGEVEAEGFTVIAKDMEVRVWYTADRHWLALESPAKGGRVIRYELKS